MDSKKMMLAIGVCAILLVAAVGVYFFMKDDDPDLKIAYLNKGGYEALIIADGKGYFSESGYDIELSPNSGSGQNCVERLLAGDVEVAATGDGPLINALVNDNYKDIVQVVCSFGVTTNAHTFVARDGSGIADPDDYNTEDDKIAALKSSIQGKKIGIIKGSTTESTFEKWCKTYLGMTNEEYGSIVFNYITNGESLVEALAANQIDAMAASNPYPVAALGIDGAYQIGSSDDLGMEGAMVLMTTKTIYEEKKDVIKAMVDAIKKATDFMNDDDNMEECLDICLEKISWGLDATNNRNAQNDALQNTTNGTRYDHAIVDVIYSNGKSKGVTEEVLENICPLWDYLAEINT